MTIINKQIYKQNIYRIFYINNEIKLINMTREEILKDID